jgi:hypothetical protein
MQALLCPPTRTTAGRWCVTRVLRTHNWRHIGCQRQRLRQSSGAVHGERAASGHRRRVGHTRMQCGRVDAARGNGR